MGQPAPYHLDPADLSRHWQYSRGDSGTVGRQTILVDKHKSETVMIMS